MAKSSVIVTTTEGIPGREIEILGIVSASTVRTLNIGRDITQGIRSIAGGELPKYSDMLDDAHEAALRKMVDEARGMGADAVVAFRFTSADVVEGATEVTAYGTAVRFV